MSLTGRSIFISHKTVEFPQTQVGNAAETQTVTIENTGFIDTLIRDISITGPFTVGESDLPNLLSPGERMTISVEHTPAWFGPSTGTLIIDAGDAGEFTIFVSSTAYSTNEDLTDLAGIPIVEVRNNLNTVEYLAYSAGAYAFVVNDPDPLKNGVYKKTGASGSGIWSLVGMFDQARDDAIAAAAQAQIDAASAASNAAAAAESAEQAEAAALAANPLSAFVKSPLTTAFQTVEVPGNVMILRSSGYSVLGKGAADYVADALATPELLANHPIAVKQDSAGRLFRLKADEGNFIDVSAFGVSSTPTPDHTVNHQPGIQAAIKYCEAIGAKGIRFESGHYSIWTPLRPVGIDTTELFDINLSQAGVPFVISGQLELVAGAAGTTFNRRKNNGSDPAIFAETQLLNNAQYWRGGMFLKKGVLADPGVADLSRIVIRGTWTFNGGIPRSATPGIVAGGVGGTQYQLNPDGSGWDISDKCFWDENDRWTGDWEFIGNITATGFRGELLYQGGGAAGRILQSGGTLTFEESDGNGFNPYCVQAWPRAGVLAERIIVRRCFQTFEGQWGFGRIDNLIGIDCTRGYSFAAVHDPAHLMGGKTPQFSVGTLEMVNCDFFSLLSYVHIERLICVDTALHIGQDGIYDCVGLNVDKLDMICDQTSNGIIFFTAISDAANSEGTHSNRIGKAVFSRTKSAIANNRRVGTPMSFAHSLGTDNVIEELSGHWNQHPGQTGAIDYAPAVRELKPTKPDATWVANFDVAGYAYAHYAPHLNIYGGGPAIGGFAMPNPQNLVPRGARMTMQNNNAGGGLPIRVDTTNTRLDRAFLLRPGREITFVSDGYFWVCETPHASLAGTINTALQKAGAAIPASGVSDEVTFAVQGAQAGMTVRVSANPVIPNANLIGRVAADNTVGIRAMNMDSAAPLNILAQDFFVSVDSIG